VVIAFDVAVLEMNFGSFLQVAVGRHQQLYFSSIVTHSPDFLSVEVPDVGDQLDNIRNTSRSMEKALFVSLSSFTLRRGRGPCSSLNLGL
jgi:hypothetical protein